MALRAYSRKDLLALTPDRYLAGGFDDADALAGEFASAAAAQLLEGEVAPQELAFTAAAFDETLEMHDGTPREQAEAAINEALEVVARLIRQPNNERLAQWLEDCAAHVTKPGDLAALQAHLDAVLKQYTVVASFSPEEPSSSPAAPS